MKERPILMSTPMVKAILEDRKTNTRRLNGLKLINKNPDDWVLMFDIFNHIVVGEKCNQTNDFFVSFKNKITGEIIEIKCFAGGIGDRLWAKETYLIDKDKAFYKETHETYLPDNLKKISTLRWKPSIFMPKKYARIWLEITGIKVERVQGISTEDCIKEGYPNSDKLIGNPIQRLEIIWYQKLWDTLNAKRGYGWDKNPFCWCISFKKLAK